MYNDKNVNLLFWVFALTVCVFFFEDFFLGFNLFYLVIDSAVNIFLYSNPFYVNIKNSYFGHIKNIIFEKDALTYETMIKLILLTACVVKYSQ